MTSPTGTQKPATMPAPEGYWPAYSQKAKSRVPGRGKSYQGNGLGFMSLSGQAQGIPGLDTGTSYSKAVKDAGGPA
jgi:hypothetical protein